MRAFVAAVVLVVAVAATIPPDADAQDRGGGAAPAAGASAPKARTIEALTFERLTVRADELPAHVRFAEGTPTASRQPRSYYENPSPFDLAPPAMREQFADLLRSIPAPTRKAHQAFAADGGVPGTVFWFEYDGDGADELSDWMGGYLWGDANGPTPRHPETFTVAGRILILTSFPQGDPAHEWWKGRLRSRFGLHAPRWTKELAALVRTCLRAQEANDPGAGLAALDAAEAQIAADAFPHYLRGELALQKGDYALSEKGYRRALELHDAREDPMEDPILFATLDGLGGAIVMQKKAAAAVPVLERAAKLGRTLRPSGWAVCLYNLSCAQALLRKWDRSLAALREAVEADPSYRDMARDDADLTEARKRPEFRKLLGLDPSGK